MLTNSLFEYYSGTIQGETDMTTSPELNVTYEMEAHLALGVSLLKILDWTELCVQILVFDYTKETTLDHKGWLGKLKEEMTQVKRLTKNGKLVASM